jgi:hypothetical protein
MLEQAERGSVGKRLELETRRKGKCCRKYRERDAREGWKRNRGGARNEERGCGYSCGESSPEVVKQREQDKADRRNKSIK